MQTGLSGLLGCASTGASSLQSTVRRDDQGGEAKQSRGWPLWMSLAFRDYGALFLTQLLSHLKGDKGLDEHTSMAIELKWALYHRSYLVTEAASCLMISFQPHS